MTLKVYEYKNCSTCKKALQFLDRHKIKYECVPIVDRPPSVKELKQMLKFIEGEEGTIKNLFNTSGVQYRELKIADQLKAGMTESQALTLLSQNGKLIKRPFALSEREGQVGFKEELWSKFL